MFPTTQPSSSQSSFPFWTMSGFGWTPLSTSIFRLFFQEESSFPSLRDSLSCPPMSDPHAAVRPTGLFDSSSTPRLLFPLFFQARFFFRYPRTASPVASRAERSLLSFPLLRERSAAFFRVCSRLTPPPCFERIYPPLPLQPCTTHLRRFIGRPL